MNDESKPDTFDIEPAAKRELLENAIAGLRPFTVTGAARYRLNFPEHFAEILEKVESGELRLVVFLDQSGGKLTLGCGLLDASSPMPASLFTIEARLAEKLLH